MFRFHTKRKEYDKALHFAVTEDEIKPLVAADDVIQEQRRVVWLQ